MYSILIVDFSVYRDSIINVFNDKNYNIQNCDSAFEAMSKLKAYDFDLVISEVELPGDNAFDLYNYIQKNYSYIPIIMTTDKNINNFFENIFIEGIGNILCKPIKKDKLVKLAEKLITRKNIFGLNNYMPSIIEKKKVRITSSKQIQKAIPIIIKEIEDWGIKLENKMPLSLVLNEMTINALYHSHGLTEEKVNRRPVKLKDGQYVDIFFARGENGFGISINDYNGKLTKFKILESINQVVEQDQLLEQAIITGEDITDKISETGRGIDFLRKITGEYYFIIKKNVRTEIIILFDYPIIDDDLTNYSSLKIIEDFNNE